jgi:hypothetical protein
MERYGRVFNDFNDDTVRSERKFLQEIWKETPHAETSGNHLWRDIQKKPIQIILQINEVGDMDIAAEAIQKDVIRICHFPIKQLRRWNVMANGICWPHKGFIAYNALMRQTEDRLEGRIEIDGFKSSYGSSVLITMNGYENSINIGFEIIYYCRRRIHLSAFKA